MATTKGIEHLRCKINTDYVEHVPRYEHFEDETEMSARRRLQKNGFGDCR